MDLSHFVYPFINWWTFGLFPYYECIVFVSLVLITENLFRPSSLMIVNDVMLTATLPTHLHPQPSHSCSGPLASSVQAIGVWRWGECLLLPPSVLQEKQFGAMSSGLGIANINTFPFSGHAAVRRLQWPDTALQGVMCAGHPGPFFSVITWP